MIASSSCVARRADRHAPCRRTAGRRARGRCRRSCRAISEWTPHELLPIIPPSVQRLCVDGIGRERQVVRFCGVARRDRGRCPAARARPALPDRASRMRFRYFEKSMTTATLQHWPARLVPAPRGRIGAPNSRHAAIAAATSSSSSGIDEADREPGGSSMSRSRRARGAGVEAHFAAHRVLQRALERFACGKNVARMRV